MRDCNSFRSKMLTAELEVLRGVGDDPLARHIAGCSACAEIAKAMLVDAESLDRVLAQSPPELDVDAVLARAGSGAAPNAGIAPETRTRQRHRALASRRGRWTAVALAACAAALLFLQREEGPRPGASGPVAPVPTAVAANPPPTVESAPGHNVAVIPTDNPNITVVWYY